MNFPEIREITAGSVTLGVPACLSGSHLKHHWSGPQEVLIPAFQLGKYSVTRGKYENFISSTGHQTPMDWDDPTLKRASLPVCGVSWQDPCNYCDWLLDSSGKVFRLPRADECEKAARGDLTANASPEETTRQPCAATAVQMMRPLIRLAPMNPTATDSTKWLSTSGSGWVISTSRLPAIPLKHTNRAACGSQPPPGGRIFHDTRTRFLVGCVSP